MNNSGYGTSTHLEAIKIHGITQYHRKTFGICKNSDLSSNKIPENSLFT